MADVSRHGPSRSRGVSTTVGYVLNLAVALLLVTGLLVAAGTFVGDQRERAARDELQVTGARLAASLESVDRLAETGQTARLETPLPRQVAGRDYRIRVNGTDTSITLSIEDPDVSVTVQFRTDTPVETRTVDGGRVAVVFVPGPSGGHLEVRTADA